MKMTELLFMKVYPITLTVVVKMLFFNQLIKRYYKFTVPDATVSKSIIREK